MVCLIAFLHLANIILTNPRAIGAQINKPTYSGVGLGQGIGAGVYFKSWIGAPVCYDSSFGLPDVVLTNTPGWHSPEWWRRWRWRRD